jgi:hypothetical protein
LDADIRTSLRQEAYSLLSAEHYLIEEMARAGRPPESRAVQILQRWRQDPDLDGIRAPSRLAGLPEPERHRFESLWRSVGETLERFQ